MCVCVCVCVYIYIDIYIFIYLYIYTSMFIDLYRHICKVRYDWGKRGCRYCLMQSLVVDSAG